MLFVHYLIMWRNGKRRGIKKKKYYSRKLPRFVLLSLCLIWEEEDSNEINKAMVVMVVTGSL